MFYIITGHWLTRDTWDTWSSKIATDSGHDIPKIAQCKPGDAVGFIPINLEEAAKKAKDYKESLGKILDTI